MKIKVFYKDGEQENKALKMLAPLILAWRTKCSDKGKYKLICISLD